MNFTYLVKTNLFPLGPNFDNNVAEVLLVASQVFLAIGMAGIFKTKPLNNSNIYTCLLISLIFWWYYVCNKKGSNDI